MANILVVDDEALIPPMLSDFLGRHGHEVKIARSPLGALGWLDVEDFSVVILDVMMAGPMNGLDICRRIRSDARFSGTRVLVISGVPEMEISSVQAGADAFLAKPFDLTELLNNVEQLIGDRRGGTHTRLGLSVRDAIERYSV